jgi:predicted nucleotide-binding protein
VKESRPGAIFLGHGKKRGPLDKLQKILDKFKVPYKVVVDTANLGRPIPEKVKDIMEECNSAILIFTRDEEFRDAEGNELWRPSENVVYELGAASFAYEDRVVILKEKGITFPTNFNSVGHIEFDEDGIEAKAVDILMELVGFGLVTVTPA